MFQHASLRTSTPLSVPKGYLRKKIWVQNLLTTKSFFIKKKVSEDNVNWRRRWREEKNQRETFQLSEAIWWGIPITMVNVYGPDCLFLKLLWFQCVLLLVLFLWISMLFLKSILRITLFFHFVILTKGVLMFRNLSSIFWGSLSWGVWLCGIALHEADWNPWRVSTVFKEGKAK